MFFWMLQQTTNEQAPIFYTVRYICHWKGGAIIVTSDLQWHVSMATNTNMSCSTLSSLQPDEKWNWKIDESQMNEEEHYLLPTWVQKITFLTFQLWLVVVWYEGCPWQHLTALLKLNLPAEFLAIFYRRDVCLISRLVGAKIRWISHTEIYIWVHVCVHLKMVDFQ